MSNFNQSPERDFATQQSGNEEGGKWSSSTNNKAEISTSKEEDIELGFALMELGCISSYQASDLLGRPTEFIRELVLRDMLRDVSQLDPYKESAKLKLKQDVDFANHVEAKLKELPIRSTFWERMVLGCALVEKRAWLGKKRTRVFEEITGKRCWDDLRMMRDHNSLDLHKKEARFRLDNNVEFRQVVEEILNRIKKEQDSIPKKSKPKIVKPKKVKPRKHKYKRVTEEDIILGLALVERGMPRTRVAEYTVFSSSYLYNLEITEPERYNRYQQQAKDKLKNDPEFVAKVNEIIISHQTRKKPSSRRKIPERDIILGLALVERGMPMTRVAEYTVFSSSYLYNLEITEPERYNRYQQQAKDKLKNDPEFVAKVNEIIISHQTRKKPSSRRKIPERDIILGLALVERGMPRTRVAEYATFNNKYLYNLERTEPERYNRYQQQAKDKLKNDPEFVAKVNEIIISHQTRKKPSSRRKIPERDIILGLALVERGVSKSRTFRYATFNNKYLYNLERTEPERYNRYQQQAKDKLKNDPEFAAKVDKIVKSELSASRLIPEEDIILGLALVERGMPRTKVAEYATFNRSYLYGLAKKQTNKYNHCQQQAKDKLKNDPEFAAKVDKIIESNK